jgi:hypothetical protein
MNRLDIPRGDGYPKGILEVRDSLLLEFMREKESPNMRVKLKLISKALMLFAVQSGVDMAKKLGQLQVVMESRRGLLHD